MDKYGRLMQFKYKTQLSYTIIKVKHITIYHHKDYRVFCMYSNEYHDLKLIFIRLRRFLVMLNCNK